MSDCIEIKREQAESILENYLKIYKITSFMQNSIGRTFAPGGRLLGDVGECVLAYVFGLRLNPKQAAGFDAETKEGNKVEIKVRTSNNHIHISDATIENARKEVCWLLAAEMDVKEKQIKIVMNSKINPAMTKDRKNGFITRANLEKYCDASEKLKLLHKNIEEWQIIESAVY